MVSITNEYHWDKYTFPLWILSLKLCYFNTQRAHSLLCDVFILLSLYFSLWSIISTYSQCSLLSHNSPNQLLGERILPSGIFPRKDSACALSESLQVGFGTRRTVLALPFFSLVHFVRIALLLSSLHIVIEELPTFSFLYNDLDSLPIGLCTLSYKVCWFTDIDAWKVTILRLFSRYTHCVFSICGVWFFTSEKYSWVIILQFSLLQLIHIF